MGGVAAGLGSVWVIFILILAVLAFLMPFFVYGINMRTKETALALSQTNSLLMHTNRLLTNMHGELTDKGKPSQRATISADNPPKDIKAQTDTASQPDGRDNFSEHKGHRIEKIDGRVIIVGVDTSHEYFSFVSDAKKYIDANLT